MKKLFVILFGGWICEHYHHHFKWESNRCCQDDSTIGIKGILRRKY